MSLDEDYAAARKRIIRNKSVPVGHRQRLELHGLFKQAEKGDCIEQPPNQDNVIAYQKWVEHNKHKGLTQDDAKTSYVELVNAILDGGKKRKTPKAPPLPPLSFYNAPKTKSKPDTRPAKKVEKSPVEVPPDLPELPLVKIPGVAKQEDNVRAEVFRSRAFSSVAGLNNPLSDTAEDIEKKYEMYEKIRAFYAKYDPEKVKRGLGNVVAWTMTNGEAALNKNLKNKYGQDLRSMQSRESVKFQKKATEDKARRESQLVLSRRLLATKDASTRKKMDKLTRFLLVNDPELVSRGMYLMVKFIEAKGLGALNENLKQNYGKSLDSVSDDELNQELKKKYGNDLGMLEQPFFTTEGDDQENGAVEPRMSTGSALESTLAEQIKNLDTEKLKQRQLEEQERSRVAKSNKQRTSKKSRRSKKGPEVKMGTESFDTSAYRHTLSPKEQYGHQFDVHQERLRLFVGKYEPYRFDDAFKLMGDFMKRNGLKELNKKLMKKYDVDLDSFQEIEVDIDGDMDEEEFELKVLQFVNKHEKAKNIERAVKAMREYKSRQGIAALNTKLYMKYGETLNDIMMDDTAPGGRAQKALSMEELHRIELPSDFRDTLNAYYAKYDPMILGNDGVDRIYEWTERNGTEALDVQLEAKYHESLSEFVKNKIGLKSELEAFYEKVDPKKLGGSQVESVLAWAVLNGRDALNFNLRRKYAKDLDSVLKGDRQTKATFDV